MCAQTGLFDMALEGPNLFKIVTWNRFAGAKFKQLETLAKGDGSNGCTDRVKMLVEVSSW